MTTLYHGADDMMKSTLRRGDLILSYEVLVKLHLVIILLGHFV